MIARVAYMAQIGLELSHRIAQHPDGVHGLVTSGDAQSAVSPAWPPHAGRGSSLDPPTTAAALTAAVDARRAD